LTVVLDLKDIQENLKSVDLVNAMAQGFISYSNGHCVVPAVGELLFDNPKGDTHIKYGYIKQQDYYVVKIASGFYENPKVGLASSQGLMLLFSQQSGVPKAVLLDEGYLTDIRTAAAGALVAKYFAPKQITAIGIIGTGIQAMQQLLHLQQHTPCHSVWVWGRNVESLAKFAEQIAGNFKVNIAANPAEVAANANLIITTTPSEAPLLNAKDIQAGTHITAVGADTEHKQELDSQILAKADIVISDSIPQSLSRGEIYQAVKQSVIHQESVIELGLALQNPKLQRTDDQQITVADLTGVAVQDIMIATAVYENYRNNNAAQ